MSKIIQFGENVEGYNIPVLNEREIRASAGILFLATFISLMFILFKNNFLPIKYVLTIFLSDFLIRVFVNPKFSPSLIIGLLIVRNICMGHWGNPVLYHVHPHGCCQFIQPDNRTHLPYLPHIPFLRIGIRYLPGLQILFFIL